MKQEHECPFCDKKFLSRKRLKAHIVKDEKDSLLVFAYENAIRSVLSRILSGPIK